MPTVAPAAANASAIARPIPELAPVTTVRKPASGGSPACAVATQSVLGAAGERVAGGRRVSQDLVGARLAVERAGDRQLRRLVVVVVDLLIVGGVPVDEDADDDHQIVDLIAGDHAVGNGSDDGSRDGGLRGTK